MNKLILICMVCFSCSSAIETEDITSISEVDNKYEMNKKVGGQSFFPKTCDDYKKNQIVLDPDWNEEEIFYIRKGAKLWEEALGIDIGNLEIASENCSREFPITNCIVKLDYNFSGEKSNKQIYIYYNVFEDHNYDASYLSDVIAHEVGHVLGISHTSNGVMATVRGINNNPVISQEDIDMYSESCS